MRIMAIDYGDARTGVAISDPTGLLAGHTAVIRSRKPEFVAEELARIAAEHGVEELVMGFPRNMDGTEGPRAERYRAFADLHASGKRMKEHKKTVDAVAATLILEGYLTYKRTQKP